MNPLASTHDGYRIYRAVVIAVEDDPAGFKRIQIQEKDALGEGAGKREALPPTPIPVSKAGSAFIATPDIDDECIVADYMHGGESKCYILTYTPKPVGAEINTQGTDIPDDVPVGSLLMRIGGAMRSVFSMTRGGVSKISSGGFAEFIVDGTSKIIELSSKAYTKFASVGWVKDEFKKEDQHTGKNNLTHHVEAYTQYQDLKDMDMGENAESITLPQVTPYHGKAFVKAGSIYNKKLATGLFPQNPYQIETRQSTGLNPLAKDTVTTVRFGHQSGTNIGAYKNSSSEFHPPGTLYEIEAKQNTLTETSTFL